MTRPIINLFDSNFSQDACSVRGMTSSHFDYTRGEMNWPGGITLFTDGWCFNSVVDEVRSRLKVAWLREPRCLWPQHYADIGQVAHKFSHVLTYDAGLVASGPPFHYAPYGGIWVPPDARRIYSKSRNISMLIGSKMSTPGHRLRHAIADRLLPGTVDFYGTRGEPVDYSAATKLRVLRDYRFSFAIETCRENGLFTEWLLDCFATGTVPLFWGAPDVGTDFNSHGIISLETVEGAVRWARILSLPAIGLAEYTLRHWAIRENLLLTASFAITEDWLWEHYLRDWYTAGADSRD